MGTRITPVCARAVMGTGSQDAVAATINAFKVAHASRQSVMSCDNNVDINMKFTIIYNTQQVLIINYEVKAHSIL